MSQVDEKTVNRDGIKEWKIFQKFQKFLNGLGCVNRIYVEAGKVINEDRRFIT